VKAQQIHHRTLHTEGKTPTNCGQINNNNNNNNNRNNNDDEKMKIF